jgi:hypothetical protein
MSMYIAPPHDITEDKHYENSIYLVEDEHTGTRKVKLFLCVTNYAVCHEDVWENGCIDPRILDHGTSWR